MRFKYLLSGAGAPHLKSFQIGEAMANAGVPVLVGGANNEGLALASTTGAADLVGVTTDAQATLVTAQQADNSDPERQVRVIINPNAVYEAIISGGATEDTALTLFDVTTASTDGLTVTTGDSWTATEYDEGTVHGHDGANTGIARKITSTSATAATVTVAFPFDTAVGDNFTRFPFHPGEDQFVQLTSAFTQVDASVAVDTDNANFRVVELDLRDASDSGRTNSRVLIVPFDSIYAAGGSV